MKKILIVSFVTLAVIGHAYAQDNSAATKGNKPAKSTAKASKQTSNTATPAKTNGQAGTQAKSAATAAQTSRTNTKQ